MVAYNDQKKSLELVFLLTHAKVSEKAPKRKTIIVPKIQQKGKQFEPLERVSGKRKTSKIKQNFAL